MTKNTPRIEAASLSIPALMKEIVDFPIDELPATGLLYYDVQPGDIVLEKVPLFMQQVCGLYSLKRFQKQRACDMDDPETTRRLSNEEQLLYAIITYFAMSVAPPEFKDGLVFEWNIRKDFVLTYQQKPDDSKKNQAAAESSHSRRKMN